jgi:glycosyltransferase involved in cell wall biosynthesis
LSGLKIAVVAERLVGTGAAEASVGLTSLLRQEGHTVRFFGGDSINVPGETEYEVFGEWSELYSYVDRINHGGQPATRRDRQVMDFHQARRDTHGRLFEELREFNPDVVHFHNVSAVLSHLSVIAVSREWPLVWTIHARFSFDMFHNEWLVGSEVFRTWEKTVAWTTSYLGRDLLAASDVPVDFVAPSRWLKDLAVGSPLGRRHRFHVVRNAVSEVTPASTISGDELRRALGVDRLLLSVVPRPEYSLKGFDITQEAFFRARALLTHDPSTRDLRLGLVVTTIQDLGLAEWGVFTLLDLNAMGVIPSNQYLSQALMRDLYSSVDAVVLASRVENLPNVVIEAIRDRCPVIATNVGGVSEIFGENDVGRLVESESVVAMANAIVEVVVTRGRDSYKDDLGHLWQTTFSPSRIVNEMESLFVESIERHHSNRARGTSIDRGDTP